MASNANFISQFVMGGDPCTYKESGELQAEMSKLTHPAVVKGAAAGRTASATGRAKTDRRGFADAVDAN